MVLLPLFQGLLALGPLVLLAERLHGVCMGVRSRVSVLAAVSTCISHCRLAVKQHLAVAVIAIRVVWAVPVPVLADTLSISMGSASQPG
jgi:hypothetical protein